MCGGSTLHAVPWWGTLVHISCILEEPTLGPEHQNEIQAVVVKLEREMVVFHGVCQNACGLVFGEDVGVAQLGNGLRPGHHGAFISTSFVRWYRKLGHHS